MQTVLPINGLRNFPKQTKGAKNSYLIHYPESRVPAKPGKNLVSLMNTYHRSENRQVRRFIIRIRHRSNHHDVIAGSWK